MGAKSPETHAKFLGYLKDSEEAVWFVARWFNTNHQRTIRIHPASQAKTHQDWKKHVDQGDLYMRPPDQDNFLRYEVKRLGVEFTSLVDWPFGTKFIVCAKHSYDNATPPPASYFILSKSMNCMAVIKCSQRDEWSVEKREDSRTNVSQEFYLAPMKNVKFHKLDPAP
jgi:hypothetical protein